MTTTHALTKLAATLAIPTKTAAKAALKAAGLKQTMADDLLAAHKHLTELRRVAPMARLVRGLGYTPLGSRTTWAATARGMTAPNTARVQPHRAGGDWAWRLPVSGDKANSPVRLPAGTPAARLEAVRKAAISKAYHRAMRVGTNDELFIVLTTDPAAVGVRQVAGTDWSKYKGKFKGWACNYLLHTVTVPADWRVRVQRPGLAVLDGLLTLDAAPVEGAPDGIRLYAARWVRQSRGNTVASERGYIAMSADGLSYHGATAEKALAGIRRKVAGAKWTATLATADLSALIAGRESTLVRVSDATAIGACDYGIRSWCAAVGLDYAAGSAPLSSVYSAYQREPRPEARAAILHALRRARVLMAA